jgi:pyruvate, orthophosphate dikinase
MTGLNFLGMALDIDGILSVEFRRQLDFLGSSLDVRGFTLTQYLDVFKGIMRAVQNIVSDNFTSVHDRNFAGFFVRYPSIKFFQNFFLKMAWKTRTI